MFASTRSEKNCEKIKMIDSIRRMPRRDPLCILQSSVFFDVVYFAVFLVDGFRVFCSARVENGLFIHCSQQSSVPSHLYARWLQCQMFMFQNVNKHCN
jgi:hypothetical protein